MPQALKPVLGEHKPSHSEIKHRLVAAADLLLADSGEKVVRDDISTLDLLMLLNGITYFAEDYEPMVRFVDVLLDGLLVARNAS
ncbi:transcriptional regulator [Gordonia sp. KTR9]|nr:hypothetical protein [Gordonia sp. KTR9]AFR49464.1 transcriptional regulator [Gordonia sp. KTR9]